MGGRIDHSKLYDLQSLREEFVKYLNFMFTGGITTMKNKARSIKLMIMVNGKHLKINIPFNNIFNFPKSPANREGN